MAKLSEMLGLQCDAKLVIGMIHLDYLDGQPKFNGMEQLLSKAFADLKALESGGVDAVLIENWKDNTCGPFISDEEAECMETAAKAVAGRAHVPVGINVLPNDYKAAFSIAKECGAKFVQLDVFVDKVKTNYSYSDAEPFVIDVDLEDLKSWRRDTGAEGIALFATVHPKHYFMLESKPIEQSAKGAVENGADAIVVTGVATGLQPTADAVGAVKSAVGDVPTIIGSGLNLDNAAQLLEHADGAIVGTAFKSADFEHVLESNVKALVGKVKSRYNR